MPGEITLSEIGTSPGGPGAGASRHELIRYRYEVDGRTYEGETAAFTALAPRPAPEALVRRFPVGDRVEVYYRAEEPGTSTLLPGGSLRGVALPGGFFLALIAAGALGVGWSARNLRAP